MDLTLCGIFTLRIRTRPSTASAAAAARPSPSSSNLALTQLRSALPPGTLDAIACTGEPVDDVQLTRWLQARGSVEATSAALTAHSAWRVAFVGRNYPPGITEASIAEELAAGKVFLQGRDPHGCGVLMFVANRHHPQKMPRKGGDSTTRLMAYALDNACAAAEQSRNSARQVTCIFDMGGVNTKNIDVGFLKGVFELLQTHYPEALRKLYFVDSPLLFWGIWRCVTPFINPRTREKIAFVSGAAGRRELLEAVGAAVLPPGLGGSSELLPIDGVVTAMRSGVSPWQAESSGGAELGGERWRGPLSRSASGAGRLARSAVLEPVGHLSRFSSDGDASRLSRQRVTAVLMDMLLLGLVLRLLEATMRQARRIKALAVRDSPATK